MIDDDRGILDLPFKLVIAMAIIAAMAPVVADMVNFAEDEISVESARHEALRLESGIHDLYYKSFGTRSTVTLDIPSGAELVIGGSTIEDQYTIRIVIDGEIVGTEIITAPSVRVVGDETVLTGDVMLMLERVSNGIQVVG